MAVCTTRRAHAGSTLEGRSFDLRLFVRSPPPPLPPFTLSLPWRVVQSGNYGCVAQLKLTRIFPPTAHPWHVPLSDAATIIFLFLCRFFDGKARLFPGCAFVVGADTAKRVVDPKYYGNSQVCSYTRVTCVNSLPAAPFSSHCAFLSE